VEGSGCEQSRICLENLKKIMKCLSQDSLSGGRNSNLGSADCKHVSATFGSCSDVNLRAQSCQCLHCIVSPQVSWLLRRLFNNA
jgi:hypothetical protein